MLAGNIKSNARLLAKFIYRFGAVSGNVLFLKFKLKNDLTGLKIPGIAGPVSLRNKTRDIETFYQIFLENEYEVNWIKNPKVIIDAGSHIGLFAVFMKNKFPDAKIICIEPDAENFAMLRENTAFYKDVYYENCGLWNKETKLKVCDKHNLGNWGVVVEENEQKGSVRAVTIDSLLKKYDIDRIDILKLDIESSEKKVFSKGFENWLSKTKMIAIELHDWMEKGCSKPFFEAINKTFESYGYVTGTENTVIVNNDLE